MKPHTRAELDVALAGQDHRRAISLLTEHVAAQPDDLEAQLELALAHMLAGDEERFATIHQRVAARLEGGRPRKGRLAKLWELSASYFERLMQAAAVVALVSSAGCERATVQGGDSAAPPVAAPEPARSKYAAVDPGIYAEYAVQRPNPIDNLRPVVLPDAGAAVTPTNPERPKDAPVQANKYGVVKPRSPGK